MVSLQPVRGMHDLLPLEFQKHSFIIESARRLAAAYGFAEMATTEDAQAVVERFNDTMLEGDELQILFADPNRIKANQFKKFQQQQYPQQRGGYPPRGGGYYPYPPPGYYPYPPHPGGHPGQYPGYPPPPPHYQGGGYGPPPPYQQAGYAKPGKPGYHPAHDPYGDD